MKKKVLDKPEPKVKIVHHRKKKIPTTLRLPTTASKAEILSSMRQNSKDVMRMIAKSEEQPDIKERLADFFLFILNILDIENEKLSYEKIEQGRQGRCRRSVQKE